MALTYGTYLKVDELLELQEVQSKPAQHDEMLFIVIHQAYELWFKQILHEFDLFRNQLQQNELWSAVKTLRRILVIMKTLVGQTDILETMTPLSFQSFRGFLDQASGFQSVQFRGIEIICGLRSPFMLNIFREDDKTRAVLQKRLDETTIWEAFCKFLIDLNYDIEMPIRKNDKGLVHDPSDHNQNILVDIMKNDPEIAMLAELLVDFDEGLQEWRYRHVKMVERTIGSKPGTGGSQGVEYLKKTLHRMIFPDLWYIRSEF